MKAKLAHARATMNVRSIAKLCACLLLLNAGAALAAERWHMSTLKFVYPLDSGDFVLGFDTDSSFCSSAEAPNKYYYVFVGQNGITLEGSRKLYAAALTALAARQSVSIVFNDATSYCYVNRLAVTS